MRISSSHTMHSTLPRSCENLKMISWNLTRSCNLRCDHCYRDAGPDAGNIENELSTEEGFKLLDELKKEGFMLVIFSGGEPLMRDDLEELVEYASEIGLRPVLGTNAVEVSRERLEDLKEAGVKGAAVSLDSVDPEIHDKFRGSEGAWAKTVSSIKKMVDVGIPVQINITISELNYGELDEIVEFAEKLGARAVHPFFLVPTGRGKDIESSSLRAERYQEMIEKVLKKMDETDLELKPTCAPQFMVQAEKMDKSLRYSRGCLAGVSYCCVLPEGEIHICPYLPVKAGDLREESFSEIWNESEVFQKLRDFKNYEGKCGRCPSIDICGGCRARAYYYSGGEYLAADPWCKVR